ncbi:hypothetical protein JCM3766R1_000022 [Sporobolomyces carnicolor]
MSEDPARIFFPGTDEIPSLYDVLSVSRSATRDDLKRAYRRLSLLHHPDKFASAASSSSSSSTSTATTTTVEQATIKFQQIGFAYSVLKDDDRRERYDKTGSTVERGGDEAKTQDEWKAYFKDLWSGEVTGQTIQDFKKKYQGSDEERQDLFDAYTTSRGDLDLILASIMCSTELDEHRFVDEIDRAIELGQLGRTTKWTRTSKSVNGRDARKRRAEREANEAERLAKELGVYDRLFPSTSSSSSSSSIRREEEDAARGGRGKRKQERVDEDEDDDDDNAALKALIQGNRDKRMSSLMDSLEAKYGAAKNNKKQKKRTSSTKRTRNREEDDDDREDQEPEDQEPEEEEDTGPTEEEFARIQAELDARRAEKKVAAAAATRASSKPTTGSSSSSSTKSKRSARKSK